MTLQAPPLTEQQLADLDVARSLAAAGIPLFLGYPDAEEKVGFKLAKAWHQTVADPSVVDRWRPGMALCAVMGHGLDLVDIDPRSGGDVASLPGGLPAVYGEATTPSGGTHYLIRSLGAGSHDGIYRGVDVKGGMADGTSRGFAFIAPTVRPSKATGELGAYRWTRTPDLPALAHSGPHDVTGAELAARIAAVRSESGVGPIGGPTWWREFVTSREPQAAAAADKAITEKLAEVSGWTPDSGTDFRKTLMRAAMTLGGYVGGGYLAEGDAWLRLEAACSEVWGAPDRDDRRWIEQGLTDGAVQPFHVYTAEDELLYGEAAQVVAATRNEPSWSPYRALGVEAFDPTWAAFDQEFAEAVMGRTAPVLRFAADAGTWVARGAHAWRERDDLSGWAVAMVARLMPLGESPVPKDPTQRTPGHWQAVRRQRFMSSGGSGAIERKLRSIVRGGEHPGSVELADLDADPEVLWAGGVAWNLRASVEAPVAAGLDPATPHLRAALCMPEVRPTPLWDAFVSTVWPDPEVRAWALRVLSLTLAGYPDAALPVLYGPERTGKTAVISLLVDVLGSYGHAADPRLLAGADTTHASVVYALKGRRLSFIDEGPRRGHLAAERLKQLTGGGPLTGNAMRANPVTFNPTHTLVMTTNDEPALTDAALRARVRLIPCEADQADVRAARQALTPAAWQVEAPGVLAMLMGECGAWLHDQDSATTGRAPASLQALVGDMAADQDPVREWVTACCIHTTEGTASRELYTAFARWSGEHPLYRRVSPVSETSFGRSLTEQGYPWFMGGDRGKTRFRPLSVMGGGPGGPGWSPLMPRVAAEGLPRVAEGLVPQPSASNPHSSGPVFSASAEGAEGFSRSMDNSSTSVSQQGEQGEETQGNRGRTANPRHTADENRGGPATTTLPTVAPEPSANRRHAASTPDPANTAAAEPERPEPSRSVTNGDVARRADEAGISKAEARAQLRAEARQAAITAAQGEVLNLPAVVDRAGNVLPLTIDQAVDVVRAAIARAGGRLDVDVETSGYPVGHPHYVLRSVQLGDDLAAVVLHPVDHAETIRMLIAEAPALGAFSATADLVPIAHAGLGDHDEMWSRMHDVVIKAKLADPRSTGASADGLKALAAGALGPAAVAPAADEVRAALFKAGKWLKETKVDTPVEKSGWAQVETGSLVMLRYAASDVLDTAAADRVLPFPPAAVYQRERLAQQMTARIAFRGVRLDADHVRTLTGPALDARAEAGDRVRAFGIKNPGSDAQIGQALLGLGADLPRSGKTGAPSVAAGVLKPLRGEEGPVGDLVRAVLDYRHHDTLLGTFLEPYRVLCDQGDGRARPTIYTVGTNTGRMSAVRPNLQQLPREGGVRACLTADPGQLMIGADFSGVEIRVAAALSQDPTLLAFLRDGRDLHTEIAKMVWGEAAAKAERYRVKPMVFGRLYGGGVKTLAAQGGVRVEVAQAVIDSLDALTPGLSAWSERIRNDAQRGYTQFASYSGRTIHLPQDRPHAAPNYCIQGSARELLVDALVRWSGTRWGSATLLPVHDELDVFVPAEEAEEATAELVRCMETELYGVKIVADPSTPSPFWQDSV